MDKNKFRSPVLKHYSDDGRIRCKGVKVSNSHFLFSIQKKFLFIWWTIKVYPPTQIPNNPFFNSDSWCRMMLKTYMNT